MDEVRVRFDTVKPPTIRIGSSRVPQRPPSPASMQAVGKENETTTDNSRPLKRKLRAGRPSESLDLYAANVAPLQSGDSDATRTRIKRRFIEASKKLRSEQLENARKVEDAEKRKQNLEQLSKAIRQNNSRRASLGRKEVTTTTQRTVLPPKKTPVETSRVSQAETKPKQRSISEIFRSSGTSERKPRSSTVTSKIENIPVPKTDAKKYSPEEIKAYMELKKVKLAKQKRQERSQNEQMRRNRIDQIKQAEEFHKKGAVAFRRMVERKKKRSRASSISEAVEPNTELQDNQFGMDLIEIPDILPQKVLVTDEEPESGSASARDADDTETSSHSAKETDRRSDEQQRFAERIRKMKESAGRLVLRVTKYTQQKSQSTLPPNLAPPEERISNPSTTENSISSHVVTGVQPGVLEKEIVHPTASSTNQPGELDKEVVQPAASTASSANDALASDENNFNEAIKLPETPFFTDMPFADFDCSSVQSEGLSEPVMMSSSAPKLENQEIVNDRSTKMDWNIFGRPAPQFRPNPLSIVNIFAARYLERKEEIVVDGEPGGAFLIPKPPAESRSILGTFTRSPKLRVLSSSKHSGSPAVQDNTKSPAVDIASEGHPAPPPGIFSLESQPDQQSIDTSLQNDRPCEHDSATSEDDLIDDGSGDEQVPSERESFVSYISDEFEGFPEEGVEPSRLSPRSLALEARAELRHFEEMNAAATELLELEYSYGARSLREAAIQAQQELMKVTNDASAVKTQLELREACHQEIQKVGDAHVQHLETLTSSVLKSVARANSVPSVSDVTEPIRPESAVALQTVHLDLGSEEPSQQMKVEPDYIPDLHHYEKESLEEHAVVDEKRARDTFKQENERITKRAELDKIQVTDVDAKIDQASESDSDDLHSPQSQSLLEDKSSVTSKHYYDEPATSMDLSPQEQQQTSSDIREPTDDELASADLTFSSQAQKPQPDASSISSGGCEFDTIDDCERLDSSRSQSPTFNSSSYVQSDYLIPAAESAAISKPEHASFNYVSCETAYSDSAEIASSSIEVQSASEIEHSEEATITTKDQIVVNNLSQMEVNNSNGSEPRSFQSDIVGFSDDNSQSCSTAGSEETDVFKSTLPRSAIDVPAGQLDHSPDVIESDYILSNYTSHGTDHESSGGENDPSDVKPQNDDINKGAASQIVDSGRPDMLSAPTEGKESPKKASDSESQYSFAFSVGSYELRPAHNSEVDAAEVASVQPPEAQLDSKSVVESLSAHELQSDGSIIFSHSDEAGGFSQAALSDSASEGEYYAPKIIEPKDIHAANSSSALSSYLTAGSEEFKPPLSPIGSVPELESEDAILSNQATDSEACELIAPASEQQQVAERTCPVNVACSPVNSNDASLLKPNDAGRDRASTQSDIEGFSEEKTLSHRSVETQPLDTTDNVPPSPLKEPNDSGENLLDNISDAPVSDYILSNCTTPRSDAASQAHDVSPYLAQMDDGPWPIESNGDVGFVAVPSSMPLNEQPILQLNQDQPASHHSDLELQYSSSFSEDDSLELKESQLILNTPEEVTDRCIDEVASALDEQIDGIPFDSLKRKPMSQCDVADYITQAILSDLVAELKHRTPYASQSEWSSATDECDALSGYLVAEPDSSKPNAPPCDSEEVADSILCDLVSDLELIAPSARKADRDQAIESTAAITNYLIADREDSTAERSQSNAHPVDEVTDAILGDLVAELTPRKYFKQTDNSSTCSNQFVNEPQDHKVEDAPIDCFVVEQITDVSTHDPVALLNAKTPSSVLTQTDSSDNPILRYLTADPHDRLPAIIPVNPNPVEEVTDAILSDLVAELNVCDPSGPEPPPDPAINSTRSISSYVDEEVQDYTVGASRPDLAPVETPADATSRKITGDLRDSPPDTTHLQSNQADQITDAILTDLVEELQTSVAPTPVDETELVVFDPSNPTCAKVYVAKVLRNQGAIDWENPTLKEDVFDAVESQLGKRDSSFVSFRRFIFDILQSVIFSLRRFGGETPPEAWHRMKPRKLRDHFWSKPLDDEIIKEVLLRIYPDPATVFDNVDDIVNSQVRKEEWYFDEHIADVQFEIADLIFTELLQDSIDAMV